MIFCQLIQIYLNLSNQYVLDFFRTNFKQTNIYLYRKLKVGPKYKIYAKHQKITTFSKINVKTKLNPFICKQTGMDCFHF